jgi:hypothetical protein
LSIVEVFVGGSLILEKRKMLKMGKKNCLLISKERVIERREKKKEMVVRCGKRNILLIGLVLINYKK